jgi:hypothetical protein
MGTAGERQGNGMGTAWERHGMCEAAFKYLSPASPSFTEGPLFPCRPAQSDKSHVRWDAILETGKWFPFQAFPVRGSIRQGCSISMILFYSGLEPVALYVRSTP